MLKKMMDGAWFVVLFAFLLGGVAHAVNQVAPGAVAKADNVNPVSFLPVGNPTKVTMSGGASVSTTVGQGLGVSIYCTVDATFKTGLGAQTATADSVQLPGGQTRVGSLFGTANTIAFYTASAGVCYISVTGS